MDIAKRVEAILLRPKEEWARIKAEPTTMAGLFRSYVLSVVAVYVFALVVNELAPTFASTKNMTGALKLAAYSMTPGWLAGVLSIVPGLWALSVVASLYGLFILYLGFDTPMMETPKDKIPGYMALSIVVVVVLYLVFGWIVKGAFAVRYGQL